MGTHAARRFTVRFWIHGRIREERCNRFGAQYLRAAGLAKRGYTVELWSELRRNNNWSRARIGAWSNGAADVACED